MRLVSPTYDNEEERHCCVFCHGFSLYEHWLQQSCGHRVVVIPEVKYRSVPKNSDDIKQNHIIQITSRSYVTCLSFRICTGDSSNFRVDTFFPPWKFRKFQEIHKTLVDSLPFNNSLYKKRNGATRESRYTCWENSMRNSLFATVGCTSNDVCWASLLNRCC